MTTRMTVQRLARLIAAGDVPAVSDAVASAPRLIARTVEHEGTSGWTPLHLAVAYGRTELVGALVSAGSDLGATTEQGRTPLHVALRHAPPLVEVLIRAGAPVDAPAAAYLGDTARLRAHLDDGAPLRNAATGVDLLTVAARGGSVPAVQLLLERGADVDCGALQAAAAAGHPAVVRTLLSAGADVDRRDPDTGLTALHAAVTGGPDGWDDGVVRLLLDARADVNATTSDGATALDISRVAAARQRATAAGAAPSHDALSDLLVAHGAVH